MKKLVIFILVVIALAPLGLYFINFQFGLSNKISDWAAFGSYVGGVYGAMAFFAVAYSIYITGVQFRKQNEDQIFYKSVDDLMNGLVESKEVKDYRGRRFGSVLSIVINKIYQELKNQSSHLARKLLCEKPTIIPHTNLLKIVYCLPRNSLGRGVDINKDEFLRVISKFKDFNECWEWLKILDEDDQNIKSALQDAGCVCFYKASYEDRAYYYQMAWDVIEKRYGEMINRYLKNMAFILSHVHEAQRREIYRRYLMSRLTKYDIVLLFYFASISNDSGFIKNLIDFGILEEFKRSECRALMLDYPSGQNATVEIEFIEERVNKLLEADAVSSAA